MRGSGGGGGGADEKEEKILKNPTGGGGGLTSSGAIDMAEKSVLKIYKCYAKSIANGGFPMPRYKGAHFDLERQIDH